MMKKTNFDLHLEEQLRDPDFAERFKRAGEAWDVALQIVGTARKGRLLPKGSRAQAQHLPAANQPYRITELRGAFLEHASPRGQAVENKSPSGF